MKKVVKFSFISIGILLLTACTPHSTAISKFENAPFSNNLFSWQQEKYCPFIDELLTSEIRCSFAQVTSFDDGDPSNPEWYFRHDDKDFTKDKEISGLDLTMYLRLGNFPASKDVAEKYWAEATKFYKEKAEYTLEPFVIDGKKAWKIMQYIDGDIPKLSGNQTHFSHIDGVYLIEKDEKSFYTIRIMLTSDTPEKVRAYQAEADQFISSIKWK